ncbi:hypothetical protein LTR78_003251 [Recurvomyces mirabilis]|uniref:Uncharacterized protein n=1 Tax=Recurvomyces mirabilis TaxID=574656 RepID=A0AAE1C3X2_9PEZI|nr:hypothetical protein LTR78_003251 [Recurvomyces mirabilis]KAK5156932.1 hypothetical protein LTS14_004449 [Recurvomyces mirabilis]
MAAAATSCAPCVLGAASSALLSFPYDIIQNVSVEIVPHVTIFSNGSSSTIGFDTTTVANEIISTISGPGGAPVATFTHVDQLTWSTLGTVLTYPTTYVEYLGFVGATATSSGCAQSIQPTALTLPANVNSASLVFPNGETNNGLPGGLLSYLDGLSGFASQLGGPAESCPTPGGVVASPPSSTSNFTSTSRSFTTITSASTTITESNSTITTLLSTSLTTLTSTLTTSTTVQSTEGSALSTTTTRYVPSPASTVTSPTSVVITSAVVPTTVAQTLTPARIFATATPSTVIIQSGSSTTLPASPTALAESMTPRPVTSVNPIALSQLIAAIGSQTSTTSSQSKPAITPAPSINGTLSGTPYSVRNATSTTYVVLNGTSTTYTVQYTGAAHPVAMPDRLAWLGGLLGLAVPILF